MVMSTFMRTSAKIAVPTVSFTNSDESETIYIANDWRGGYTKYLKKEDYSKTGYIGRGSAKQVIYVRRHIVTDYWKNINGSLTVIG